MNTVTTNLPKAYAEIVEFFAAGTTPPEIVNFQLSDDAKERISDLIYRHNHESLTSEEKNELDNFLHIEHLLTLIKAMAQKYIIAE
ncbi:MAG: hypothetical protein WBG66_08615 [Geitlerinemataceae cyanobacterium]